MSLSKLPSGNIHIYEVILGAFEKLTTLSKIGTFKGNHS